MVKIFYHLLPDLHFWLELLIILHSADAAKKRQQAAVNGNDPVDRRCRALTAVKLRQGMGNVNIE